MAGRYPLSTDMLLSSLKSYYNNECFSYVHKMFSKGKTDFNFVTLTYNLVKINIFSITLYKSHVRFGFMDISHSHNCIRLYQIGPPLVLQATKEKV